MDTIKSQIAYGVGSFIGFYLILYIIAIALPKERHTLLKMKGFKNIIMRFFIGIITFLFAGLELGPGYLLPSSLRIRDINDQFQRFYHHWSLLCVDVKQLGNKDLTQLCNIGTGIAYNLCQSTYNYERNIDLTTDVLYGFINNAIYNLNQQQPSQTSYQYRRILPPRSNSVLQVNVNEDIMTITPKVDIQEISYSKIDYIKNLLTKILNELNIKIFESGNYIFQLNKKVKTARNISNKIIDIGEFMVEFSVQFIEALMTFVIKIISYNNLTIGIIDVLIFLFSITLSYSKKVFKQVTEHHIDNPFYLDTLIQESVNQYKQEQQQQQKNIFSKIYNIFTSYDDNPIYSGLHCSQHEQVKQQTNKQKQQYQEQLQQKVHQQLQQKLRQQFQQIKNQR